MPVVGRERKEWTSEIFRSQGDMNCCFSRNKVGGEQEGLSDTQDSDQVHGGTYQVGNTEGQGLGELDVLLMHI